MEYLLRFVAILLNFFGLLLKPIYTIFGLFKVTKKVEPITDELLLIPAVDLAEKIRFQQVKSETVIRAYIKRIKSVNSIINAVVENRFDEAIEDAKRADLLATTTVPSKLENLYPLLGVPFTVKESCGLKGFSQAVGCLNRKGLKAEYDGDVIANLKTAGAIPLLVSANPEFCVSWECSSLVNGTCKNPYNDNYSPGGSSGGEGALIGAGASLFGVGSDIAGSIRIPALFNGVFGHKATGGLLSTKGHFPYSSDPQFQFFLQTGPICRYAKDLQLLLQIMAGENFKKLNTLRNIELKDIKIYQADMTGSKLIGTYVSKETQHTMLNAVKHFRQKGLEVNMIKLNQQYDLLEITLGAFVQINDVPSALEYSNTSISKTFAIVKEIFRLLSGRPQHSLAAVIFTILLESKGFMFAEKAKQYSNMLETLKTELIENLGENGVLIYPTMHRTAFAHAESYTNIAGVLYTTLFNVLGFPATHVPMGLSKDNLPIGFQVVAAPYQDELCLKVAEELESKFGGWVPH